MNNIPLGNLTFRMLSYIDFHEFKSAVLESIESNQPYLVYGSIFQNVSVLDYVSIYMSMMKSQEVDHFGLFHGKTLLAHAQYEFGLGPHGTELIGWTRKEFQNQRIGELGLATATQYAFNGKNFNYVELKIDSKNLPSRRVAEKVGFKPFMKIKYEPGAEASAVYYLMFNPRIIRLANQYRKRPIDIINSPASKPPHQHFLKSSKVSEFYEWPFNDFDEDAKPVNFNLLSSYLALINLGPNEIGLE